MTPADTQTMQFGQGYVTTHASIAGKTTYELELTLGYQEGTLIPGYTLLELVDPIVSVKEFEWRDCTNHSAGWIFDAQSNEYVQCNDLKRAENGSKYDYDESKSDAEHLRFKRGHLNQLNVRSGPDRIVKVVPRAPKKGWAAFPDSPLNQIPQWELTVPKRFRLIAKVVGSRNYLKASTGEQGVLLTTGRGR